MLREELSLALGSADVQITRSGRQLALEVVRSDSRPIDLQSVLEQLDRLPPLTACLGLTADGRPLMLRLPSPDVVHVLIAGVTGSGKTELMRTLAISLTLGSRQSQLQLALIDLKQRGLAPLGRLPHLIAPPASNVSAAQQLLAELVTEMEHRDANDLSDPHLVIIVDELPDLLQQTDGACLSALTRIATRGRESGLHLVLGMQQPSSKLIGCELKANLPLRLVGRVGSADDARVATGIAQSGAERLLGRGDFVAISGGQVVRFQAAYVPATEWASLDKAIYRGKRWSDISASSEEVVMQAGGLRK